MTPRVSVAIPVYNEETVLPELYRRVRDVLGELPGEGHQIVFVNDGSRDGSPEMLRTLVRIDERVKLVNLSRNFGHQAALTAALDHVGGDVVVLMDGDLQDRPEAIPQFLARYAEGYDVVYAVREKRQESWLLRTCYAAFYRTIAALAEVELPLDSGDFALLSRRVIDEIRRSPERNRYLRGLRSWVGFPQIGIRVQRSQRHSGESKYSLTKLLKLAFDGIFSFSVAPLRAATLLGSVATAGSLAFTSYAVFAHLFLNQSPAGFTALLTAITFLAGVQLLFLGLIGEYVGRVYEEVKQRPHYVVECVETIDTVSQQPSAPAIAPEVLMSLIDANTGESAAPLRAAAKRGQGDRVVASIAGADQR